MGASTLRIEPGLVVVTTDEVEIGTIIEVERNAEGVATGIIVELCDRPGHESRFPAAWIIGVRDAKVHLIVAASDIVAPGPLDLFRSRGGNIFGRDPP